MDSQELCRSQGSPFGGGPTSKTDILPLIHP